MPIILVDTAAWIALVNTRDELHERAKQIMAELHHGDVALGLLQTFSRKVV